MRRVFGSSLAVAAVILIPSASLFAQGETSKGVAGGGITAAGWTGQVDANEAKNGMTVNSAKLAKEGDGLHVTTGPAIAYWNPANKATGNYTVKVTFKEPKWSISQPSSSPSASESTAANRRRKTSLLKF